MFISKLKIIRRVEILQRRKSNRNDENKKNNKNKNYDHDQNNNQMMRIMQIVGMTITE